MSNQQFVSYFDSMPCLVIDSFMYVTYQYTKINFTCLITTFHVPRYILNSLQTVTQTHHCTGCLFYRLCALFQTHADGNRLTIVHDLRYDQGRFELLVGNGWVCTSWRMQQLAQIPSLAPKTKGQGCKSFYVQQSFQKIFQVGGCCGEQEIRTSGATRC